FSASPALRQLAVLPVPKHVKLDLNGAARHVGDRHAHAEVATNVVPMADCHLQLWKYVPVNLGQVDEVAIGDEFHHRSPGTAKTMIGGQDLTYGAVEEERLRRNVGMAGQIGTELRLEKSLCLKKLIVSGEGFKRGRAPAKSARTTPAGHQHAALQSENRARA